MIRITVESSPREIAELVNRLTGRPMNVNEKPEMEEQDLSVSFYEEGA